ncbi:MAG: methyltransferase domain-containing protein [Planctomycetota bacterium]
MTPSDPALTEPAGLPPLVGGWERREHPLEGASSARPVTLWVPRAPDALLDDAGVIERSQFHDVMPYWAWLWDSAPRMAALVARAAWPSGARVLELGAGLGLCGLVAARLGCAVTLSDHDPLALAALRVNADANGLSDVAVWDLDWRALEGLPPGEASRFDVVLGCDVVYEAQAHGPVLDVLERCLAPGGEAWIADPGRTRAPSFVRRAEARGFSVEVRDAAGAPAALAPSEFRLMALRARA